MEHVDYLNLMEHAQRLIRDVLDNGIIYDDDLVKKLIQSEAVLNKSVSLLTDIVIKEQRK